jgi:hypothetical protein
MTRAPFLRSLFTLAPFALSLITAAYGQPGAGPIGPGPGCSPFPTPANGAAPFTLSYFGASPTDNLSLAGPVQLLTSGTVDAANGTITLPLYQGLVKAYPGELAAHMAWYVLTDVSDSGVASYLGINYSPKLAFAAATARPGNFDGNGNIIFNQGKVDFTPQRNVVPGMPAFPPATAIPGATADSLYSPLVSVANAGGIVFNAPMIAFDQTASAINFPTGNPDYSKVHDQVVKIDTIAMTVTLNLINGFSAGRPVWYLSTEASSTLSAALEGAIYAPALAQLPLGVNGISTSAEPLFVATNGASAGGCANPLRQGLTAALTDGHRPSNVLGAIPTMSTQYSPLWDAIPYEWTPASVSSGYVQQMRDSFQVLQMLRDGLVTGPGGSSIGTGSFIVNCPIAVRLN